MKYLFVLFLCFLNFGLFAQQEILINKNINALKVASGISVELFTNSEENKIEADVEVLGAINYKVKDNELRITLPLGKLIEGNLPLNVKVFLKEINNLNVVQGSIVEIQNIVKQNSFSIRATEGTMVSGEFETENLDLKSLSGASIDIRGKSKNLNVLANTGGNFKGRNLQAENTIVEVTYGGSAMVNTTETCEASIVVGGTIDIYGNPKYVNEKTSFGGDITIIKD